MDILCGGCGRTLTVDDTEVAGDLPCPHCGRLIRMSAMEDEALEILLQLGYSQADALRMIGEALGRTADTMESADELITEVFRSKPQEEPGGSE